MEPLGIMQKQARLVAEFEAIPDWQERFRRIIDRARTLPPFPEEQRTEANKVRGCASSVWLHATSDGTTVTYLADSDAVMTKGLIALLLQVYSGHSPEEILASPPDFIEELGLNAQLSPNRANGLGAMVRQIKAYALAFHRRP
jgi:cysteine desulfuration protein SufE